MHLDGLGLYLPVTPNRSRSWVYRFTLDGQTRDMGLGSLNDVSLDDGLDSAAKSACRLRLGSPDRLEHRAHVGNADVDNRHVTDDVIGIVERLARGRTHAAYQRGNLLKKRRLLMQDWADYCASSKRSTAKKAQRRPVVREADRVGA